jgi:glycosyltransferase involved in cell wall biosynthesis
MRIAFITSEFSGLPGSGGIGSYFLRAARCLAAAGQEVEVFTSGNPGGLKPEKGITLHQLEEGAPPIFGVHAADAFAARHREAPFDILECGELKAEGLYAMRNVRDVARVVRLHSPTVLLGQYLDLPPTRGQRLVRFFRQARIAFGAWRRGLPVPAIYLGSRAPWYMAGENEEREIAVEADLVIVMNDEMRRFARDYWWIKDEAIIQVPNPMQFSVNGMQGAPTSERPPKLGFIGRLEPRKGVLELARALEQILPRHPGWSVVFAGQSVPSCLSGADVGEMARQQLKSFGSRVQFPGSVPPDEIDALLAGLDLCVFPSLWETFHYAVIEAMAAGKAIVATRTGAVADMLDEGRAGLLVDPGSVPQLARALDSLMADSTRRRQLGHAARQRVLANYNEASVTASILDAYRLAMKRRDQRRKDKAAS